MHWYKRNIGDYAKKAGRLTMLQHGSYTLLLDACYDRERFPTIDEALEWTWASTKEEVEAIEFVLKRYFSLQDGVYIQERIQDELEIYKANAQTNSRIAVEREAKRRDVNDAQNKRSVDKKARSVLDNARSVNEAPPNQEPRTINHKLRTKNHIKTIQAPEGVSLEVWNDFVLQRKKARAVISENIIKTIAKEANKAGWSLEQALAECSARGWRGFKAEWVIDKPTAQTRRDQTIAAMHELTGGLLRPKPKKDDSIFQSINTIDMEGDHARLQQG
jgi:uncharacterized protein YdaU (DUF1376 family)